MFSLAKTIWFEPTTTQSGDFKCYLENPFSITNTTHNDSTTAL